MTTLARRLAAVLGEVLPVVEESDGALTVRHAATVASLRVVPIGEGLDLVSLTQVVGWDLPLSRTLREQVERQAAGTLLGTVAVVAKEVDQPAAGRRGTDKTADVMLRYNFPGTGLTDDALRTLVLLVLDKGAEIRDALRG
ncbi:MAG TPA: hypothetical protein VL179_01460 [Mycobacterium sp.]|nr:hypothetical protein [Mycobacterium sp.]